MWHGMVDGDVVILNGCSIVAASDGIYHGLAMSRVKRTFATDLAVSDASNCAMFPLCVSVVGFSVLVRPRHVLHFV